MGEWLEVQLPATRSLLWREQTNAFTSLNIDGTGFSLVPIIYQSWSVSQGNPTEWLVGFQTTPNGAEAQNHRSQLDLQECLGTLGGTVRSRAAGLPIERPLCDWPWNLGHGDECGEKWHPFYPTANESRTGVSSSSEASMTIRRYKVWELFVGQSASDRKLGFEGRTLPLAMGRSGALLAILALAALARPAWPSLVPAARWVGPKVGGLLWLSCSVAPSLFFLFFGWLPH